jgi:hypothetical protein
MIHIKIVSLNMLDLIKKHIAKSENQKQKKKKAYMPLWESNSAPFCKKLLPLPLSYVNSLIFEN